MQSSGQWHDRISNKKDNCRHKRNKLASKGDGGEGAQKTVEGQLEAQRARKRRKECQPAGLGKPAGIPNGNRKRIGQYLCLGQANESINWNGRRREKAAGSEFFEWRLAGKRISDVRPYIRPRIARLLPPCPLNDLPENP